MSLSKHLSMIEGRLGQLAHIKIILWRKIKFKLIAFHDSLDNPKVEACKSKWQTALLCTRNAPLPYVEEAALPTPTTPFQPLLPGSVVSTY